MDRFYSFAYDAPVVGGAMTIGGLAFRTWRPFLRGAPGTIDFVNVSLVHQLSGTAPPSVTAPPPGTQVVSNLQVSIPDPRWSARSWDEWPIRVPFNNATFAYDGTSQLGIWMHLRLPDLPFSLEVDGVSDGIGLPYAYQVSSAVNPPGPVFFGDAPVLGLFTNQTASVGLRLFAIGEPDLEPSTPVVISQHFAFTVTNVPDPPVGQPRQAFLVWGGKSQATFGSCLVHSDGVLGSLTLPAPQGHAFTMFGIPLDTALLHAALYFQASAAPAAGGLVFSNGLKVRLGGTW